MTEPETDAIGEEDPVEYFRRTYSEPAREEGRRLGREEGRRLGFEESRLEAAIEFGKRFVHKLLRARGLVLTPEQMSQLEACQDADLIECWVDRLLAGESVAQCLAERAQESR